MKWVVFLTKIRGNGVKCLDDMLRSCVEWQRIENDHAENQEITGKEEIRKNDRKWWFCIQSTV